MNGATADAPEISPVLLPQRAEAFALVFSYQTEELRRQQVQTLMTAVATGELSSQGLLGAFREGRLVGAVLSKIEPGKTAMVWTPRLLTDEPAPTADRLLRATSDFLARRQIRLAQIQVQPEQRPDEPLLRRHGYEPLADLLYLLSQEDQFPTKLPQGPLQFEPYDVVNHKRLAHVVEATYRETLDCPQLDGVREIEDILAGYRTTGVFDPKRWLIVRHRGQDAGCLLLADHPDHGNWELVYMGVASAHRGHGWGMEIARHAQWLTRQAGRSRLVLAVDAANHPAIDTYAAVGFRAWERRSIFLKVFDSSP